jgi:hypothetical protein
MDEETLRRNSIIIHLLADIPANLDDNDPMLTEAMQRIFDKYFADHQARYAGMPIEQRVMGGGKFTVPDSRDMKQDCIEEMRKKLTSFDINDISNNVNRIRLRRMLAFLENMPNAKSQKSFMHYIIGIPDNHKHDFAVALRKEFANSHGLEIRYMIEGLIDLRIIQQPDNISKLYAAISDYFGGDIGTRQGIFGPKMPDDHIPGTKSWKKSIESATNRIASVLKPFA